MSTNNITKNSVCWLTVAGGPATNGNYYTFNQITVSILQQGKLYFKILQSFSQYLGLQLSQAELLSSLKITRAPAQLESTILHKRTERNLELEKKNKYNNIKNILIHI